MSCTSNTTSLGSPVVQNHASPLAGPRSTAEDDMAAAAPRCSLEL